VAHACHPSYLGGWDQEDWRPKPAWTNSSGDPISKITRAKWAGGVGQVVELLLCKCKALSSNPNPTKKQSSEYPKELKSVYQRDTALCHCTAVHDPQDMRSI
jgi:hypothetical protein